LKQLNENTRTLGKVSAYLIGKLYEQNKPIFAVSDAKTDIQSSPI